MTFKPITVLALFVLCTPHAGARHLEEHGVPTLSATSPQSADVPDGARCLLCDRLLGADDLVLIQRGRRVPLCAGECKAHFESDPVRHLAALSAQAALFQEGERQEAIPASWFWCGVYILAGLIAGAGCAFIAVNRGRAALGWFFAGLFTNVAALLAVCFLPARGHDSLPAGIPRGLRKVPTTRSPAPCPYCAESCHPSARACRSCGADLQPVIASEVDTIGGQA